MKYSIAVPTFRRPDGLKACLASIVEATAESTSHHQLQEILVIDNDAEGSAAAIVQAAQDRTDVPIRYVCEARPGVVAARNRALEDATGEVLAFIDDDETAEGDWPLGLVDELERRPADLAGGPVRNRFQEPPPEWFVRGGFLVRDEPETGTELPWLRSGNLAVRLEAIHTAALRFDDAFNRSGGEDVEFTRRASHAGLRLSWAADAVVTETVPPSRIEPAWLKQRERVATANFVRATLRNRSRASVTARAIPTVVVRSAEALAYVVAGKVTRQKHLAVRGTVLLARAWGTIEGLVDKRWTAYGSVD
ncbi:MAG: glycosyltransferase family 2 protein [Acidimicrobiales bacterium]